MSHHFDTAMVSCGWGRIINIGSIYGEAVQVPNISIFTATKFAVHGFTRALSRELGATGVTVNAVQPGFIFTELSTADGHEVMKRLTSVGRYGTVGRRLQLWLIVTLRPFADSHVCEREIDAADSR